LGGDFVDFHDRCLVSKKLEPFSRKLTQNTPEERYDQFPGIIDGPGRRESRFEAGPGRDVGVVDQDRRAVADVELRRQEDVVGKAAGDEFFA
jgi:hypothetical protein